MLPTHPFPRENRMPRSDRGKLNRDAVARLRRARAEAESPGGGA